MSWNQLHSLRIAPFALARPTPLARGPRPHALTRIVTLLSGVFAMCEIASVYYGGTHVMFVMTTVYAVVRSIDELGVLALVARYHYPRQTKEGCIRHEGKTLHPPFQAISVEMICRAGARARVGPCTWDYNSIPSMGTPTFPFTETPSVGRSPAMRKAKWC